VPSVHIYSLNIAKIFLTKNYFTNNVCWLGIKGLHGDLTSIKDSNQEHTQTFWSGVILTTPKIHPPITQIAPWILQICLTVYKQYPYWCHLHSCYELES